jgi:hypothetical protein
MTWLSDWAKRIEITVDNTNIDSDSTHFPIPIVLGSSVGQSSDDVSAVFDELGSESKKIAITKSDGTTQIYAEIESWDNASEEAVIWVSKSDLTLSSSGTTTLYLYYDSNQSDNTTYVGDPGSRTEVWNSTHDLVWNLDSDATDSTSNGNDGTIQGSLSFGDGLLGGGPTFDGTNDRIDLSALSLLYINNSFSLSFLFNVSSSISDHAVIINNVQASGVRFGVSVQTDGTLRVGFYNGSSFVDCLSANISFDTDYHLFYTYDTSTNTPHLYIDNTQSEDGTDTPTSSSTAGFCVGGRADDNKWFPGKIDELHIFNEVKDSAFRKASYYSLSDNLLTFGAETYGEKILVVPVADVSFSVVDPVVPVFVIPKASISLSDLEVKTSPFSVIVPIVRTGLTATYPTFHLAYNVPVANIALGTKSLSLIAPLTVSKGLVSVCAHRPWQYWTADPAQVQIIYQFVLTGSADGESDITIPISSCQMRRRDGEPTYMSVVVPGYDDYADEILARTNGDMVLYKGVKFRNSPGRHRTRKFTHG